MLIKIQELWKHQGVVVQITEEMSSEYLPRGNYTFVEKEEYGLVLYRQGASYILDEWDDDDEIFVSFSEPEMRIETLIEALTYQILGLISDGWYEIPQCEKNVYSMDLSPYLENLKSLVKLRSVLNGLEGYDESDG